MKTIKFKSGQILEVFDSRKEAIEAVIETIEAIEFALELALPLNDDSIYVEYKDGNCYMNIDGDITGKFKKTNIRKIILGNAVLTQVFGEYRIFNFYDEDETYSPENDDEEKDWNIE